MRHRRLQIATFRHSRSQIVIGHRLLLRQLRPGLKLPVRFLRLIRIASLRQRISQIKVQPSVLRGFRNRRPVQLNRTRKIALLERPVRLFRALRIRINPNQAKKDSKQRRNKRKPASSAQANSCHLYHHRWFFVKRFFVSRFPTPSPISTSLRPFSYS